VIRHALAPVASAAAASLRLPRTLPAGTTGIAITFDDGPHPEGTPAMLEMLSRARAHATFFMVGEQVARRPALAAEVAAAGHRVALHGFRHRLQLRTSPAAIEDDLRRGTDAIAAATGIVPDLHRPPYGIYSAHGLAAVRAAGMSPLLWSAWGRDWRKLTTPARIFARVEQKLSPGGVILLHDADFYSAAQSHRRTVQALGMILAELERRKLGTVLPV
jgi:peptidoglycan-N-acetylglucosamine deacetylase